MILLRLFISVSSFVYLMVFKSAKEDNVSCIVNIIKACSIWLCLSQHLKQMPQVQRALWGWFQHFYSNQREKENEADVCICSPTWSLYGKYFVCFADCITTHSNTRIRCVVSSGSIHFLLFSCLNTMIDFRICNVRSLEKTHNYCAVRGWNILCKMITERNAKSNSETFLNDVSLW